MGGAGREVTEARSLRALKAILWTLALTASDWRSRADP